MHILLTHEQADFDAVASLLGAYLLNEATYPVLPRRVNRNVRAFLALYGSELPFVEARDLPNQQVELVTLVDTQSLVSVRGMGPWTRVQVVDHHPRREGLPADWQVTIVETGATSTILTEALREANGSLLGVHATLLLLGIYEDTGSLTYDRTTARDLRAAAFLLEQGASLKTIASFINQPLSPAQQELYDRLRRSARTLNIHGHTVVIASGDAVGMDEELSSIAHKLRDLLEPDALFLAVNTRNGIQMIARSNSDHIDVAAILAHFGGGGHERAAAGLVRGREGEAISLESLCRELEAKLWENVRPALTVAEIMSRDPQLLTPDTPLKECAQRMQRYGYEGYPVVDHGRIVGLLTRREVDRALNHQLFHYRASNLMEAGEHFVRPDDSIDHLQRVVAETGWGQVPVVDESGQIVGIVTRTDLLKTLHREGRVEGGFGSRLNLADKLEAVLPADWLHLLRLIAEEAHRQRVALYIVGGFVRDLLLERPSLDFDLVVEGDAIQLARSLAERHGGRVTGHSRFGTAKWHLVGRPEDKALDFSVAGLASVDLVSARTEFYTYPSALPTVERGSIKLDLHRRDFTINTLALRLDGRHYGDLHDYWGGLSDLRERLVRVLHSLSFVDDPTRILRAVRFEQRLDFRIEGRTLELLQEARPLVERLSGDRIRHELDHILDGPATTKIMQRLQEMDLLRVIHPALQWDNWLTEKLQHLADFTPGPEWQPTSESERQHQKRWLSYALWLLRLPEELAQMVTQRLKLSVPLTRIVLSAGALWRRQEELNALPPGLFTEELEDVPLSAVLAVYLAAPEPLAGKLQRFAVEWRHKQPLVDGIHLKKLGLPPGPVYKEILKTLRRAWLDGQISSPQAEEALLQELLRKLQV